MKNNPAGNTIMYNIKYKKLEKKDAETEIPLSRIEIKEAWDSIGSQKTKLFGKAIIENHQE